MTVGFKVLLALQLVLTLLARKKRDAFSVFHDIVFPQGFRTLSIHFSYLGMDVKSLNLLPS